MYDSLENSETRDIVLRFALVNAILHGGKAQVSPILGKTLGEKPELKSKIKNLTLLIRGVVREVNEMTTDEQKETIARLWPETVIQEKEKKEEKKLPSLPNADKYAKVVTRFAPNPDCVLHLGSARAIILSHEYARTYHGSFMLRFEDTDPRLKKSSLHFFDLIRNDIRWLDCTVDAEYTQSDRIEIYYEYAERLIKKGHMYICICDREEFRRLLNKRMSCPCRSLSPQSQIARWEAMLERRYREGEAVARLKTDLDHPNPAIRDWPAFRIINTERFPHPRLGDKYTVWPLYNFSAGIDDHLMGVTHIIRGKEHLTNQRRQEYLYKYLGWEYPEALHYGRLKIEGALLSKSKILKGVKDGTYCGWDDPRLATFLALRRRGIQPGAIKRIIVDIGPRPADITLSWDNLYAYNRKIVDPSANRYFFLQNPLRLKVKGVMRQFDVSIPLHPEQPERGTRRFEVKPDKNSEVNLLVSRGDSFLLMEGMVVRLMDLFNVQIAQSKGEQIEAMFRGDSYSDARKMRARLIHWLLDEGGISCRVVMPDASVVKGLAEGGLRVVSPGSVVQFERFGFVRIDSQDSELVAYYTHK